MINMKLLAVVSTQSIIMCPPSDWASASCFRMVPVMASLSPSSVTYAGRTYCDFSGSGKPPPPCALFGR